MRITVELLMSKGACDDQVARFAELFPDGGDATADKCVTVADQFDWIWAASHLLPVLTWKEYVHAIASAQADYARVKTAARAEYKCVMALALARYVRAKVSDRAEHHRIKASARAEYAYERGMASARAEYERLVASTFGKLAERTK